MVNFTLKSQSLSADRVFTAPITDAAAFDSVITTILADTTMGLTKKTAGACSYTAKIEYFDASGEVAAAVSLNAETRAIYNAAKTFLLAAETAAAVAGTDAEAAELSSKATWNARVSCAIGDDTFILSLNRDKMVISGYANAETLAAVETWADTVQALC